MSNESQRTPGPWRTDEETEHQSVLGPDGYMVADCAIFAMEKDAPTSDRCTANARIIAAVPEMLEALVFARMTFADIEVSKRKGYFTEAPKIIAAAIDKAKAI
jgi:hypothetical protein